MKIFEIPDKLIVSWNPEVRAITDTWLNYTISCNDFKKAVLEKGVSYAKANNGIAWIVDSSNARGLFSKEQLDLINKEIFPTFRRIGIEYFITIKPTASIFTLNTVNQYSAMTGPHGLKLIDVSSVQQAVLWLKNQPILVS